MAIGLAAAFVAVSLAGADQGPPLRPRATITARQGENEPTFLLAADGDRVVAWPVMWNPIKGTKHDVESCDTETIEVALADGQVASVCVEETNQTQERDLQVEHFQHAGGPLLFSTVARADELCAQTCLGNVAGRGDLLVFNTFRTPRAKTLAGHWWIWRIVAGRKTLVLSASKPLPIVAVARGRIFVRSDGHLVVLSPGGKQLASYSWLGSGRVGVSGDILVARTDTGVTLFDLRTRRTERTVVLPRAAKLQDVEGDAFVYTVGATIHIHRLDSKRDVSFTPRPDNAGILVRLSSAGPSANLSSSRRCPGRSARTS